jgi:hypothetical protein
MKACLEERIVRERLDWLVVRTVTRKNLVSDLWMLIKDLLEKSIELRSRSIRYLVFDLLRGERRSIRDC